MISKSSLKDKFKDALPLFEKFAPSIAGAIGGPVGVAAGYIIPILATAFGTHPSDISGMISNLLADPNAQEKLQEIEHEHGDWLCTLTESVSNLVKAEIHISLEWANESK